MTETLTMKVPVSQINALIKDLEDDVGRACRPAAQAGAQVLVDEVRRNVDKIGKVTGSLSKAIYQVYSRRQSKDKTKAVYHIGWNSQEAPHGHLVEFGHVQYYVVYIDKKGRWKTSKRKKLKEPKQVGARPFIRPAMAKFGEAIAASERVFIEYMNKKNSNEP